MDMYEYYKLEKVKVISLKNTRNPIITFYFHLHRQRNVFQTYFMV